MLILICKYISEFLKLGTQVFCTKYLPKKKTQEEYFTFYLSYQKNNNKFLLSTLFYMYQSIISYVKIITCSFRSIYQVHYGNSNKKIKATPQDVYLVVKAMKPLKIQVTHEAGVKAYNIYHGYNSNCLNFQENLFSNT